MSVPTRISVCSLTGKGTGLNMFSIPFDLFNKVESRISWGVLGAQALPCTYHLQDTKGTDRRAEQRGPRSLGCADNNRGADDSGRGGKEKAAALLQAGEEGRLREAWSTAECSQTAGRKLGSSAYPPLPPVPACCCWQGVAWGGSRASVHQHIHHENLPAACLCCHCCCLQRLFRLFTGNQFTLTHFWRQRLPSSCSVKGSVAEGTASSKIKLKEPEELGTPDRSPQACLESQGLEVWGVPVLSVTARSVAPERGEPGWRAGRMQEG